MRRIVYSMTLVMLLGPGSTTLAKPTLVARYSADDPRPIQNPSQQGWTEAGERENRIVGQAAVAKTGEDYGAWQIADDDNAGDEDLHYYRNLTSEQVRTARRVGFAYRWRLRIPADTAGPTRAIGTEVCLDALADLPPLRIEVRMRRDGDRLWAYINAGSAGIVSGSVAVADADDFHLWTMLFDGTSGGLNVYVDDEIILAAKIDREDSGHHLVFGSRVSGTGISQWNLVEFYTGLLPEHKFVPPPSQPFRTDVFTSGKEGYVAFRIPSLLTTSKGTLLAMCEGRKTSLADLGNHDLVLKRSTDGGQTWGPLQLVADEGEATIGNPTLAFDRLTETVWLLFSRNATEVLAAHSKDEGRTWSEPVEITSQVKKPDWKFYAVGPGVGIQLRNGPYQGRLVIPAYHRTTKDKSGPTISHVFYSDDGGESWKIGGSVGPHTCECQVVEVAAKDASRIIINARNHWARSGGRPDLAGKRIIASSADGGVTWAEPTFDDALIEPQCQASVFRYSWASPDEESRVLFANPASSRRRRMTIRLSYNEARTWPVSKVIEAHTSGYCCLTRLRDGRVGLIYEAGSYERLEFVALSVDWLRLGRDAQNR